MIKCKIKLTDGSNIAATLPETTIKDLVKFLNAPSSGDTEVKLGDFLQIGKNEIINRHQIVRITAEEIDKEDQESMEFDEDDNTQISSHVHKKKNPNGPKRSQ